MIDPGEIPEFTGDLVTLAGDIKGDKYMKQLSLSDADRKIMYVDSPGTLADWQAEGIPEKLMSKYQSRNIMFIVRLDDGSFRIPPDGDFFPRGGE